jgi:ABC-type nitrate/sulfonate/bicarbonate transport system ATPase subunit
MIMLCDLWGIDKTRIRRLVTHDFDEALNLADAGLILESKNKQFRRTIVDKLDAKMAAVIKICKAMIWKPVEREKHRQTKEQIRRKEENQHRRAPERHDMGERTNWKLKCIIWNNKLNVIVYVRPS